MSHLTDDRVLLELLVTWSEESLAVFQIPKQLSQHFIVPQVIWAFNRRFNTSFLWDACNER
jgi:hypothetical protein